MEWACTVKRKYFDAIKDGRKRFEVRKRLPKIVVGDILFVCCSDEVIKCRVISVEKRDKREAWYLFACRMCVDEMAYNNYLEGREDVCLIGLRMMRVVAGEELARFRSAVERNPQWFSKVKF